MHGIDILIFVVYFLVMLGVGVYFMRKNQSNEDYYVGGRSMGAWHVGMSVVATDVGGGFSIGLGGLGFMIGISGSWMLFTGLIGAWLAAIFLIPKVTAIGREVNLFTFPQVFDYFFNKRVGLLAGIISGIGYIGFTSSQILAGAKLASATFDGLSLTHGVILMGLIAVIYTVLGGIKAVIYTDTIQWAILIFGLVGIGLPLGYYAIGGWAAVTATLSPEFTQLTNSSWQDLVNWAVTIIPIWFVGMTLYQRIYACKSEKEAKKAWFIAGLLEYPIMAFMGVLLGLFARVAFEQGAFAEFGFSSLDSMDAEMGLPLFLKSILPFGLLGLMLSAYFSAIMSTADSCLMAASGNVVTDIAERFFKIDETKALRLSQWATLAIGLLAIGLAVSMTNVLELMLLSYAFMVSGLFVPIIGALYWKKSSSVGALLAMIGGGSTTIALSFSGINLPFGLDPNVFGISVSLILFVVGSLVWRED